MSSTLTLSIYNDEFIISFFMLFPFLNINERDIEHIFYIMDKIIDDDSKTYYIKEKKICKKYLSYILV